MTNHYKGLQTPECQHNHANEECGEEADMSTHYFCTLDSHVRDLGAEHVIFVDDFVVYEFVTHILFYSY